MNFIDYINLTLNGFYLTIIAAFFGVLTMFLYKNTLRDSYKLKIVGYLALFITFIALAIIIFQNLYKLGNDDFDRMISSGLIEKSDIRHIVAYQKNNNSGFNYRVVNAGLKESRDVEKINDTIKTTDYLESMAASSKVVEDRLLTEKLVLLSSYLSHTVMEQIIKKLRYVENKSEEFKNNEDN